MDQCDLALLLVSPDFIASRFIQDEELPRLLRYRATQGLRVVPIVVRPCIWTREPALSGLQALPKDGRPVVTFPEANGARETAWVEIGDKIEALIRELGGNT
jgi:hypothetical protein